MQKKPVNNCKTKHFFVDLSSFEKNNRQILTFDTALLDNGQCKNETSDQTRPQYQITIKLYLKKNSNHYAAFALSLYLQAMCWYWLLFSRYSIISVIIYAPRYFRFRCFRGQSNKKKTYNRKCISEITIITLMPDAKYAVLYTRTRSLGR